MKDPSEPTPRWIMWDIDGTLIRFIGDSRDKHAEAVLGVLALDQLKDVRTGGMTDLQIIEALFTESGSDLSDEALNRAMSLLEDLTDAELANGSVEALPGVIEALAELADMGWSNGVLTGNTPRRAQLKLGQVGVWTRLSGPAFFGDSARNRFELVRGCADRVRAERATAIVVGDTPLDVAAARAVGLPVVAVASGSYTGAELRTAAADLVLEDLVSGLPALTEFALSQTRGVR
jgi:phosphoglycolate phosphatase